MGAKAVRQRALSGPASSAQPQSGAPWSNHLSLACGCVSQTYSTQFGLKTIAAISQVKVDIHTPIIPTTYYETPDGQIVTRQLKLIEIEAFIHELHTKFIHETFS